MRGSAEEGGVFMESVYWSLKFFITSSGSKWAVGASGQWELCSALKFQVVLHGSMVAWKITVD